MANCEKVYSWHYFLIYYLRCRILILLQTATICHQSTYNKCALRTVSFPAASAFTCVPLCWTHSHKQLHDSPPTALSRQHLLCVHMHLVCVCLYCTYPTSQPALHPAVSGVAAEIDKLMLTALCLRSLLEWEENTTCLPQQYENTHKHASCIHMSLSSRGVETH